MGEAEAWLLPVGLPHNPLLSSSRPQHPLQGEPPRGPSDPSCLASEPISPGPSPAQASAPTREPTTQRPLQPSPRRSPGQLSRHLKTDLRFAPAATPPVSPPQEPPAVHSITGPTSPPSDLSPSQPDGPPDGPPPPRAPGRAWALHLPASATTPQPAPRFPQSAPPEPQAAPRSSPPSDPHLPHPPELLRARKRVAAAVKTERRLRGWRDTHSLGTGTLDVFSRTRSTRRGFLSRSDLFWLLVLFLFSSGSGKERNPRFGPPYFPTPSPQAST